VIRLDGKISKIKGRRRSSDEKWSSMALKKGNIVTIIITIIVVFSKFYFGRSRMLVLDGQSIPPLNV
jgi:hypothetical protein